MGSIIINGKQYKGNSMRVSGDLVIVDGEKIEMTEKEINIIISGDMNGVIVDCCDFIECNGNIGELRTVSGDVQCGGIGGNVKTVSGDVQCAGDIKGSVKTVSGDITK